MVLFVGLRQPVWFISSMVYIAAAFVVSSSQPPLPSTTFSSPLLFIMPVVPVRDFAEFLVLMDLMGDSLLMRSV